MKRGRVLLLFVVVFILSFIILPLVYAETCPSYAIYHVNCYNIKDKNLCENSYQVYKRWVWTENDIPTFNPVKCEWNADSNYCYAKYPEIPEATCTPKTEHITEYNPNYDPPLGRPMGDFVEITDFPFCEGTEIAEGAAFDETRGWRYNNYPLQTTDALSTACSPENKKWIMLYNDDMPEGVIQLKPHQLVYDDNICKIGWQCTCGNEEICDGKDNDCDGMIDEDFDKDGDTYTTCGTRTLQENIPNSDLIDCKDQDDIGSVTDNNGNTYDIKELCSGGDEELKKALPCAAYVNPGAEEICNNAEDNCDNDIDKICKEGFGDECSACSLDGYCPAAEASPIKISLIDRIKNKVTGKAVDEGKCKLCKEVCDNKPPEFIDRPQKADKTFYFYDLGRAYGSMEDGFKFKKVNIKEGKAGKEGGEGAIVSDYVNWVAGKEEPSVLARYVKFKDDYTIASKIAWGIGNSNEAKVGNYILQPDPSNCIYTSKKENPGIYLLTDDYLPAVCDAELIVEDDGTHKLGWWAELWGNEPSIGNKKNAKTNAHITLCPNSKEFSGSFNGKLDMSCITGLGEYLDENPDLYLNYKIDAGEAAYKDDLKCGTPTQVEISLNLGGMYYDWTAKNIPAFLDFRKKVLENFPPTTIKKLFNQKLTIEDKDISDRFILHTVGGDDSVMINEKITLTLIYKPAKIEGENAKIYVKVKDEVSAEGKKENKKEYEPLRIQQTRTIGVTGQGGFVDITPPLQVWKDGILYGIFDSSKAVVNNYDFKYISYIPNDNCQDGKVKITPSASDTLSYKLNYYELLNQCCGKLKDLPTLKKDNAVFTLGQGFSYYMLRENETKEGIAYKISSDKEINGTVTKTFYLTQEELPYIDNLTVYRYENPYVELYCDIENMSEDEFTLTLLGGLFKTSDNNFEFNFSEGSVTEDAQISMQKVKISNCTQEIREDKYNISSEPITLRDVFEVIQSFIKGELGVEGIKDIYDIIKIYFE